MTIKHIGRLNRICPVVRQQCLLKHGCVLFDVAVTDQRTLDDKARAYACPKRGAYIFPDELKERRFKPTKHDDEHRYNAVVGQRRRVHTLRRHRDQLSMFPADGLSAAEQAGTPAGG